jgi:hypothetical protein
LQYVQEGVGEGSPFPARERDELAHDGRLQAVDRGVEPVRDDVVWKESDAESRGGEMGGCRDLAGLYSSARSEAGGCTHFEDEFGEAVLGSE